MNIKKSRLIALWPLLYLAIQLIAPHGQLLGQTIDRSIIDGTTPPSLSPGGMAGSWRLSDLESINPYSGSLLFSVPLATASGRGEVHYDMRLPISSQWILYRSENIEGASFVYPTDQGFRMGYAGYGVPFVENRSEAREEFCLHTGSGGGQSYIVETLTRLQWHTGSGGIIELVDTRSNGASSSYGLSCSDGNVSGTPVVYNRGRTFISTDGSSMTYVSDTDIVDLTPVAMNGILYLKDGTRYKLEAGRVKWVSDRHGNLVTFMASTESIPANIWGKPVAIKDPLGRRIEIRYGSGSTYPKEDLIDYPGTTGMRRITIRYKLLQDLLREGTIKKINQLFPQSLYPGNNANDYLYNPPLAAEVELPNGKKFAFQYNEYGELARVTLPTGGAIEYDHIGLSLDGSGQYGEWLIYRRVKARREYNVNGLISRTDYSVPLLGSMPPDLVVTATDYNSLGDEVRKRLYKFHGNPFSAVSFPPLGYPGWREGREFSNQTLEGGVVLESVQYTWAQRGATNESIVPDSLEKSNDPRIIFVQRTTGTFVGYRQMEYSQDTHNNVTRLCEGHVSGGELQPKRCTENSYVASQQYVTPPVHLRSLVQSVAVRPGLSASVESFITSEYDAANIPVVNYTDIIEHDDTRGSQFTTRGNISRIAQGAAVVARQYDIAGNVVAIQGPDVWTPTGLSSPYTSIVFGDRFSDNVNRKTYALPGVQTDALGMVTEFRYHWPSGRIVESKNANSAVTLYEYQDVLDRLTSVDSGVGRTEFVYDDSARVVTSRLRRTTNDWTVQRTQFDGFGRTISSVVQEGSTEIATEIEYDSLGRVSRTSNPRRNTPSQWTTFVYDAIGRVIRRIQPDGSSYRRCFSSNETIEIDEGGKWRRSVRDAFGRITSIVEDASGNCDGISKPSGLNALTEYSYNARDQIVQVTQSGRIRSFGFNDRGLLVSSNQPENGSIQYAYDAAGNLVSKTKGAVVVSYLYDRLSRIKFKSYNDGTPSVSYCYDGILSGDVCSNAPTGVNLKGRLTMVSNAHATVRYTGFDVLGRVTSHTVQLAGLPGVHAFGYEYNGQDLTALVYPSGRRVEYGFDGAGRVNLVRGVKSGQVTVYVDQVEYAPHGGYSSLRLGQSRTEQWCYNERLQPVAMRVGSGATGGCAAGAGDLLRLGYGYAFGGNNGNLLSQSITRPGFAATQTYVYDALNRISGMWESSGWWRNYGYDAWSNRWVSGSMGFPMDSFTPGGAGHFNEKNQYFPEGAAAVDAAGQESRYPRGNQAVLGARTFAYDGEDRVVGSTVEGTTTAYGYDGEGRRVKKGAVYYLYTAQGELAAEYGSGGGEGRQYVVGDHLGSTRAVLDGTGQVTKCYDYLPFGEQLWTGQNGRPACYGTNQVGDGLKQRFTGKERDGETGLDYFGARYFSAAQGRFTSPDPHNPLTDFDTDEDLQGFLEQPQHWNRYVYGLNNPLKFVDDDGRLPHWAAGFIGGAAVGGGVELAKQLYNNGGNLRTVDYQRVGAKALSGGVVGATAAATFGGSLLLQAGAVGTASVVGGIAERAVDGDPNTAPGDKGAIAVDAVAGTVAGAVGGAVGRQVQNQVANSATQKLEVRIADHGVRATAQRSASRQAAAQARMEAARAAPERAGRAAAGAARGATSAATREAGRRVQEELERRKREGQ